MSKHSREYRPLPMFRHEFEVPEIPTQRGPDRSEYREYLIPDSPTSGIVRILRRALVGVVVMLLSIGIVVGWLAVEFLYGPAPSGGSTTALPNDGVPALLPDVAPEVEGAPTAPALRPESARRNPRPYPPTVDAIAPIEPISPIGG